MTRKTDAKLIDTIDLPGGLRGLDSDSLKQISEELRDELIDCVSSSGGHFASSLGATEITVALHHMFNTPDDRLVWDVGHQAYIHKMLTGRRDRMKTIRKKDGISGFLKREESEHDSFGAGHAGTSISAAVGMSVALQRLHPERFVVSIIGDGSITAGMAFEALNNAGALGLKNFIVILNDNEMSISKNVGAISWLFSRALTSKASTMARSGFKSLYKKGYVPELVYKAIDKAEEMTQSFISTPAMLFEAFGFRYIGPVDGHSIPDLVTAIGNAKQQDVPVLIHVRTQKGKGYQPAESDPIKWHGVNPFDRSKGEFAAVKSAPVQVPPTYTGVFADTVINLTKSDPKILAITAAMPSGTGLDKLQKENPEAFIDVGICEQHAVTFAAGLACEGYKPICAIYSTFLQRAYDQVVHDVCIQNLPVIFAMDRAGVVGNDGETHQGVFDIGYLRGIPNMTIMSPKDENELQHMIFTATNHNGPIALRYPRGNGTGVELDKELKNLPIGKGEMVRNGTDALIIALGPLTSYAMTAAETLSTEGISVAVMNARFAKPLDTELLAREIPKYRNVCVLEDHAISSGFGAAILEFMNDEGIASQTPVKRFGVSDQFIAHASQPEQHLSEGYDPGSLAEYIRKNHGAIKKLAFA